jgi:chemotaxis protein MotA
LEQDRDQQIKSATGKVNGSTLVVDWATPAGIGLALIFLLIAIVVGGAPLAFLSLPAFLIVVGGVIAVTVASFSWQDLRALWPVIRRTVHYRHRTAHSAAMHVLELADYARHNGILKLQGLAHDSTYNERQLHEGLQHIIDAMPHDHVEHAMRMAASARSYRHGQAISVLRRAADVAPAMGLIGTLVGLVQMLTNLQDPAGIGPGMAVALLTTLYGACLGHLALSPLAAKLERLSAAEDLLDEIYIQAVGSIGRKENPRRLELHLNSILPPPERVHFYD